ncbi:hypothetical protein ACIA5D_16985 [Actinoplanes sp. NPDC051513]|uniref:hypothetical protein n=1 Tax=Actinoplanes sp. NPDC051513 TaxID=3363908 RepID=UPI0037B6F105
MDEEPPSGALLLRVWCDREGVVARFFDWTVAGAEDDGPPRYAAGIEEITEAVRRWLLEMSGE